MKILGQQYFNTGGFKIGRVRRFAAAVMLLEVVLALGIFASTVAVVWSAISNSRMTSLKMERRAKLDDLAFSLVSEARAGIVPIAEVEGEQYDDDLLSDYTWSMTVTEIDNLDPYLQGEKLVTVTVRHLPSGQARTFAEVIIN